MRRGLGLAVAAVAPFMFVTCGGQQSALDPASETSRDIAGLWWLMLAISAVVVAVVIMFVLAGALRDRDEAGRRRWLGRNDHRLILLGGVLIPLAVLVGVFLVTLSTLPSVSAPEPGEGELVVEVVGRQWFWEVHYPEYGFSTANEIHIPAGTPVELRVTSQDVLHSFWVPRLNRKIDMIPGRTGRIELEAEEPGFYRGQCAEFCGLAHAQMAFRVVAEDPDRFEEWAREQAEPAVDPGVLGDESAKFGQQVFLSSSCVYCHAIRGTSASGQVGPDLTHLAGRETLGALTIPNTRGNLAGWIIDPQSVKPGNRMPPTNLSGPELQALLDYLETLE